MSHLGARRLEPAVVCAAPHSLTVVEEAEVDCSENIETSPSKDDDERIAGILGDHCTSNAQFELGGSSHMISAVSGSQQSVRLSLPAERRRRASLGHHEAASTPLWWPLSSFTGAKALRRSQICSTG